MVVLRPVVTDTHDPVGVFEMARQIYSLPPHPELWRHKTIRPPVGLDANSTPLPDTLPQLNSRLPAALYPISSYFADSSSQPIKY